MNAEYIAKSLEAIKVTQHGEETIPLQEFADFIRQQQAEIEALKNRNWDLVSEPWGFDRHPAKTLTDEEIQELAFEYLEKTDKGIIGVYDFVKAILQKVNNG